MAAASSKPTLVHFSLVFFILASLVLGLLYYVAETGRQSAAKAADEQKTKLQTSEGQLRQAVDDLEACKQILMGAKGAPAKVRDPNNLQDANTLWGKMNAEHFAKYGANLSEKSYDSLITKIDESLRTIKDNLTKKEEEYNKLQAQYIQLEADFNTRLGEEKTARDKAEKDVQDLTKTKAEAVATLETDIKTLKDEYAALLTKSDNEKLAYDKEKKDLTTRINNLTVLNQKFQEELERIRKSSFEEESGFVRHVDSTNRLVYINLGEADRLPKRMTFSVYTKSNSGIARGPEDIKGSIEVVRIVDAHTSECRVLSEDIHNPISSGDPIFTPLWTPGHQLRFAFVGGIDLDGDKTSDRDQLHELLKMADALIDSEVDDKGEMTVRVKSDENPLGITEQTKFLVLGKLPELADATDQDDVQRITKINQHKTDMLQAARERGVRVVTLPDFLAWMGFKNQRRLFKPGTEQKFNLKSGARSASVGESIGDRTSPGQTTQGADPRNKNLKPPTSSGTLNKIFQGKR